jgi:hypothetical protein
MVFASRLAALLARGIGPLHNLAQDTPGFPPCRLGCIWRTVSSDRVPALPALGRAVEDEVGDGLALLTPRDKARHRGIPDRLPRFERSHLAQSDCLPHRASLLLLASCLLVSIWSSIKNSVSYGLKQPQSACYKWL